MGETVEHIVNVTGIPFKMGGLTSVGATIRKFWTATLTVSDDPRIIAPFGGLVITIAGLPVCVPAAST
jgi:hypothetical protein